MNNILLLFLILILTGCSSSGPKSQQQEVPPPSSGNDEYAVDQPASASDAITQAVEGEGSSAQAAPRPSEPLSPDMYKRFNLARIGHQTQSAVEAAGEILARNPNDIKVLNGLGIMYIEQNKLEAAKLVISRALAKAPKESALHNNAGIIELKQKNLRGALIAFKRAIELDGGNRSAHANLGTVYLQYRNYQAAAAELGAAVDRGDQRPEVLSNYGFALRWSGNLEKSLWAYEKAGETKNASILLNYAQLLIESVNRPKRGLKVINKIRMVATDPVILEKARDLAKKAESMKSQEKEIPGDD